MSYNKPLTVIGRVEHVQFLDLSTLNIPAKIDTGADLSSIWVSNLNEKDEKLVFNLFGKSSKYYSGKTIEIPKGQYKITRISNSFGKKELRYVVKLRIKISKRIIKA